MKSAPRIVKNQAEARPSPLEDTRAPVRQPATQPNPNTQASHPTHLATPCYVWYPLATPPKTPNFSPQSER
jgi:hypothetical protein